MPEGPTPDKLVDLRVAHLNMIQGVIARMSGFSAAAKNFCVTINAAILGFAFQKQNPALIWAAAAVVLIFYAMDTYYLALEKRFRALYEAVAARPFADAAQLSLIPPKWCFSTTWKAARSLSVVGFYALLLLGVMLLLSFANHEQPVRPQQAQGAAVRDSRAVGDAASARGKPTPQGTPGSLPADATATNTNAR